MPALRWKTLFRGLFAVYAVLCVLSLLLVLFSSQGWFGMPRDPLSGIFAMLLALPWSALAVLVMDSLSVILDWIGPVGVLAGMIVNGGILWWLGSRLGRARVTRPPAAV